MWAAQRGRLRNKEESYREVVGQINFQMSFKLPKANLRWLFGRAPF